METNPQTQNVRACGWTVVLGLAAVEGLAALLYLASLPADAENAGLLGFSTRRLALMAVLAGLAAGFAWLAGLSSRPAWRSRWLDPLRSRAVFNLLLVLLPVGAAASLLVPFGLMSLYRASGDFVYFAFYERLLPFFVWAGLVCLQSALWLAWAGGFNWPALRFQRSVFRAAGVMMGLFALVWIFVALTGIGIIPDLVGWGEPAVALLEWQIWLAWLVGVLFLLFLANHRWPARRDWIVAAAIWLLAAGLWLGQPVRTAFFATPGRVPNYEIYPFSDGAYYGLFSQSILIGNGFKGGEVPPRPLYIALLAGFHALAGQEYEDIIVLQTLLLACFPVVLYFIGRELHSRPAGLVIALLAILREVTAIIATPFTDKASTSQMFFADLPAALVISLWALLAVMWLKSSRRSPLLTLLVGGSMGLAMLVRTQSVFMLPFVLLFALFGLSGGAPWRARLFLWLRQVGWVALGLFLAIAPWLWRNWQVTGQLAFDDPKTQTGVMAQRLNLSEQGYRPDLAMQPTEDLQSFSNRMNQNLFQFMLAYPERILGFLSAHTLNAEIDNLLLLPVRSGLADPRELLMPTQAFWEEWRGNPSGWQALLMALNLAVISIGIGAAWARHRWAGIALLLMNLSYNGSNALARNSGWRYLLPVDWITYVYAGLGLMELAFAILLIMGVPQVRLSPLLSSLPGEHSRLSGWKNNQRVITILAGLAFLLVSSVLPLVERVVPPRYPLQTQDALADELLANPLLVQSGLHRDKVASFLAQPGARILKGRALYPRYYEAGDGEPRTAKTGYEPLDYARTVLQIASNDFYGLVILRSEQPPAYLPNAADVIVLGCMQDVYLDARVVLVLDEPGEFYLSSTGLPERCPLTETPAP